jgi:SAM-dependent methyltransferase
MSSVKSSVKGWKTAGARLAVSDHRPAGADAGSRLAAGTRSTSDRRGIRQAGENLPQTGCPGSYTTNRGLSNYAEVLPTDFCDTLGRLRSSDRWLDIGAGEGQAILDCYAPQGDGAPEKCAGSGPKARVVAISIEDRRTDKWKRQTASLGDDRIRSLSGKRLQHYSPDELGKFQIITDVYGGFTYTENLSRFLEKVLGLLEIGGAFYTVLPAVHLEHGADKLGTWYKTELVDAASRPIKVCSCLGRPPAQKSSRVEDRLGRAHAVDKNSQGLQRRRGSAHEPCGVHGGGSSQQAIPIGAVGDKTWRIAWPRRFVGGRSRHVCVFVGLTKRRAHAARVRRQPE